MLVFPVICHPSAAACCAVCEAETLHPPLSSLIRGRAPQAQCLTPPQHFTVLRQGSYWITQSAYSDDRLKALKDLKNLCVLFTFSC